MTRFILPALCTFITFPAFARESPSVAPVVTPAPASEVAAQPPPNEAAAGREHRGFYLRGELGGGYRSFSFEQADMQASGGGLGFSLLLGGSVVPNLFVVGELSASMATNPTLRRAEQSVQSEDMTASLVGFGPGIVYYLMPANVSFGASALLSRATLQHPQLGRGETELGFGGSLRVGKEWWLGSRTGLGLNGQFQFASMKDKGVDASVLATAFTVSALFTYD
jgi:hypothetical protein